MQQPTINTPLIFDTFYDFCIFFDIVGIERTFLFQEAITHSSICKKKNYERLEFLGDTILNFCISRMLFEKHKNVKEGILSKRKMFLISGKMCCIVCNNIKLCKQVKYLQTSSINPNSIFADALEAFFSVIYKEYGINKVYNIIYRLFEPYDAENIEEPKMVLQELCMKKYKSLPIYTLLKKEGTEHEPIFSIEAKINNLSAIGIGANKKEAEKQAAKQLLLRIKNEKNTK